jgi:hypothetical protein
MWWPAWVDDKMVSEILALVKNVCLTKIMSGPIFTKTGELSINTQWQARGPV